MPDTKPWYTSRTLWTNAIGGVALLASAMGVEVVLDAAAQTEVVAGILVVANFILRLRTNQGVSK